MLALKTWLAVITTVEIRALISPTTITSPLDLGFDKKFAFTVVFHASDAWIFS